MYLFIILNKKQSLFGCNYTYKQIYDKTSLDVLIFNKGVGIHVRATKFLLK